jgi:uncharacterized membrane protein
MQRWIRAASWLFFAAVMYLILVEAVAPWLQLPGLGNIGFTLVFVLFALLHCTALEGLRRTAVFFFLSAIVSFLMEEIGVRTGLIFGPYHYGSMLGAKLGHVPVLIPLAWFMMIYPSWTVARAIVAGLALDTSAGLLSISAIAAIVMTGWDMVMDPGMSAAGNWIWEQGGAYFGVPLHNYFGWLLTTFIVYWLVGRLWRSVASATAAQRTFAALPILVYAFFALRYVLANSRFPELRVVALFSMGTPALIALIQTFLNRRVPAAA